MTVISLIKQVTIMSKCAPMEVQKVHIRFREKFPKENTYSCKDNVNTSVSIRHY